MRGCSISIISLVYLFLCAEAFSPCKLESQITHRSPRNSKWTKINNPLEDSKFAPLYATTEQRCEKSISTQVEELVESPRIVVECKEISEENKDADERSIQSTSQNTDDEYQEEDDELDEEAEVQRRRRAAMAARLMKKGATPARSRSGSVSESKVKKAAARDTSVGARREGSASRVRSRSVGARGSGLGGQILKGIRGTAAAAAAAKRKADSEMGSKSDDTTSSKENPSASLVKKSIQSTIDVLIDAQNEIRNIENSAMEVLGARIGNVGFESNEEMGMQHLKLPTKPLPGTILVDRKCKEDGSQDSILSKQRIRDNTVVKVATVKNDLDIAKLRLSVFSDFSPEIRRQFRSRSCEVLGNRRQKGATCLVASVDYSNADMKDGPEETSPAHNWVIGSVECSTHEFAGTRLGMRRPGGSILYVTEVAVSPRARRTGTGTKLLQVRI